MTVRCIAECLAVKQARFMARACASPECAFTWSDYLSFLDDELGEALSRLEV